MAFGNQYSTLSESPSLSGADHGAPVRLGRQLAAPGRHIGFCLPALQLPQPPGRASPASPASEPFARGSVPRSPAPRGAGTGTCPLPEGQSPPGVRARRESSAGSRPTRLRELRLQVARQCGKGRGTDAAGLVLAKKIFFVPVCRGHHLPALGACKGAQLGELVLGRLALVCSAGAGVECVAGHIDSVAEPTGCGTQEAGREGSVFAARGQAATGEGSGGRRADLNIVAKLLWAGAPRPSLSMHSARPSRKHCRQPRKGGGRTELVRLREQGMS